PEGKCLTWLTNGSPSSNWPQWTGAASAASGPGQCGAVERTPMVEGRPTYLKSSMVRPHLWLGTEFEGRLYSDYVDADMLTLAQYTDCGEFRAADCPDPIGIISAPACLLGEFYGSALSYLRGGVISRERGAPTVTVKGDIDGEKYRKTLLFSGRSITGFTGDLFTGEWLEGDFSKEPDHKLQQRIASQLRPIGSDVVPDRLPGMKIPRNSLRLMLKIERTKKRVGSVRKTAKRLKIRRHEVRRNLAGLRFARRLGPLQPMKCARFSLDDFFEETSSGYAVDTASVSSRVNIPALKLVTPDLIRTVESKAADLLDELGVG
ncbi:MAG: hypothetical protein M3Y45_04670, partial [Actinomycetota bacterium]|nr:hypothetical protein [Actinomycetota bacterium]